MMTAWSLPTIDLQRCDGCGQCVEHCPGHAVELVAQRPVIVRPHDCVYCGDCETVCPQRAINLHYEIVLRPAPKSK